MPSELVNFPPQPLPRELYLIGFRLDPASEGAEFYTLMGEEGESERPIARDGRILFFRQPLEGLKALMASNNGFADVRPVPKELELLCDIGGALYVANSEAVDEEGVLFETIAVFDDLLRAIRLSVPDHYARVLALVAARLTENPEFAAFLDAEKLSRNDLEDALMWCVGAVMVKSTWIE
ncbi:MAG: hypothetical protein P4M01_00735 [Acidobacteriota bacterium]|nr:hypothetical protein [Acidobacteriota bacterium]